MNRDKFIAHLKSKKGKSLDQIYGEEKAANIRDKVSHASKESTNDPDGYHQSLKGKTYSEIFGDKRACQILAKISESLSGRSPSPQHREHLSKALLGNKNCLGKQNAKGIIKSLETRQRIGLGNKGKRRTPETCQRMSKGKMGHTVSEELREKMRIETTNRWKRDDYVAKQMKGRRVKPNKEELRLSAIIGELSLPYRYVGDGQFILGGKCPDFLNVNGQKKLIEYWGTYWHRNDDPQERIDFFQQYGFATLIIKKEELKALDKVKEHLLEFDKQPVA